MILPVGVAIPPAQTEGGNEMNASAQVSGIALALLAGACTGLDAPTGRVAVPEGLRPGEDEVLTAVVPAKGVQIYECRARKDASGEYEWAFVAPEADLYDTQGRRVGHHYGGPHWESDDGSRVVGALKARADAPAAGTIPWLLLSARSVGPQGAFSAVSSIQRVNTTGGAAPRNGCSQSTAGRTARVGYTADYYFYAAK